MNVSKVFLFAIPFLVTNLVACGGRVDLPSASDPAGQGGNGVGTTTTTGAAAGGAPAICDPYLHAPEAQSGPVTFHVVNKRSTSINVVTVCGAPYDIEVAGVVSNATLPILATTCENARDGNYTCCDCDSFGGVEIKSGEAWDTVWDGLFQVAAAMPAECYASHVSSGTDALCYHASAPAPGPMMAVIHLYEAMSGAGGLVVDPFDIKKEFLFGADSEVEIDVQ